MTTTKPILCAALILCVTMTGCKPLPQKPEIQDVAWRYTPDHLGTDGDIQSTVRACSSVLAYYGKRAREGTAWDFGISTSGALAGVVGAALMAASPANVAWAAAFSAYAGATNATTEKLRAGGMGGSAAADYRERLRSSVQDALDAAIDADANTEQRRQALLKARTRCELEMGSEQAETNTTPPAPPST